MSPCARQWVRRRAELYLFFEKRESCDANGPDCRATQETLDVGRTKNSRQVARAQCKTAGRPPSKGVRRRVVRRCRRQRRQGGAGGGRTARSARLSIRKDDHASGAALGAAVVHAVLDLCVTRQAHKVCQARRVARPAAARAGGAVVRVREVRLKIVEADRARRECRRGGVGDARKLWGEHGRRPCHISVTSPLGQRKC